MSTTQTTAQSPPLNRLQIPKPIELWYLTLQNLHPLNEVDTSEGSYEEAPPAAGLNSSTGQTNQNQEITYVKTSADANTFTLKGDNLPLGPYPLTAQGQVLKIKSNGTDWYKSA